MVNLALDKETIYNLLDRARQYQVKDDFASLDMDDDMDFLQLVSDYNSDFIYQELATFINDLREDQQATLVALMYVGRGDYSANEWFEAYRLAQSELSDHTGEYLLSRPLVADDIAQALNLLGIENSDD